MRPRSTFQNFVSQYNGWRMERQGLPLAGSGSVSPTTPKAFANYSPGLLQPWVYVVHHLFNSEGVPPRQTPSVLVLVSLCPRVGATLGCKLANAFGVVGETDPLPSIYEEFWSANPPCLCASITDSRFYDQPGRNGSRCHATDDQPGLCGNAATSRVDTINLRIRDRL